MANFIETDMVLVSIAELVFRLRVVFRRGMPQAF